MQEGGFGMAARNTTMEGRYAALIHTNKELPLRVLLSLLIVTSPPLDGLSDSGLDRLLPPPGDDEQPDRQRKEKGIACIRWHRIGGREALGSDQPAQYDEGEARQSHQVANRPGNSCRPHDHDREQHQRETKHEVLIAICPPLQPPDGFSTGKACRLLHRWCAYPRINRLLEGNPIHSIQDADKCKRHSCQNGTEETHPVRCSLRDVEREEQDEQSRREDHCADELPKMHGGPIPTGGIVSKKFHFLARQISPTLDQCKTQWPETLLMYLFHQLTCQRRGDILK